MQEARDTFSHQIALPSKLKFIAVWRFFVNKQIFIQTLLKSMETKSAKKSALVS